MSYLIERVVQLEAMPGETLYCPRAHSVLNARLWHITERILKKQCDIVLKKKKTKKKVPNFYLVLFHLFNDYPDELFYLNSLTYSEMH